MLCFRQAIDDNVDKQRVQGEGFAQNEGHVWKLFGQLASKSLQIVGDMRAGGKEVGEQEDAVGPLLDAGAPAVEDRRFGQLQVGDFDDRVNRTGTEGVGQADQIEVGCIPAAAVAQSTGRLSSRSLFFPRASTPLVDARPDFRPRLWHD